MGLLSNEAAHDDDEPQLISQGFHPHNTSGLVDLRFKQETVWCRKRTEDHLCVLAHPPMDRLRVWFLIAVVWLTASSALKSKNVHLRYPVKALFSQHVQDYSANVTGDTLVCFRNIEHALPTVVQTAFCLVPFNLPKVNCAPVWGSRTLVVRHTGDMEFLKVSDHAPELFLSLPEPLTVVGTRWMEFQSIKDNWLDPNWIVDEYGGRHMTQIAVEPITICARSTNPYGETSYFHASFRNVYTRERDRRQAVAKLGYHILLLLLASSIWFLPYLVAFVVAIYAYLHGLKIIMALLGTGTAVLCLTPFMLTKKNRQLAYAYLNYYFKHAQAAEAKQLIRNKKPLFQALFFSSLLLCSGSAAVYMLYHYAILDREFRNVLLRINIGISLSWFAFFFSRSFEHFFCDWMWIVMAYMVSHFIEQHINPLAHSKMQIVVGIFSGLFSCFIRWVWRKSDMQVGLERLLSPPIQSVFRIFGWRIRSVHRENSLKS